MVQTDKGEKNQMQLNLPRETQKAQTIENLISAGVLTRSEVARYDKVLNSYDNLTLARVLVVSHELREAGGEIIT